MKVGEDPIHAFSLRNQGIVEEISFLVRISEAYEPPDMPTTAAPPPNIPVVEYKAIWDTGATRTAISPKVVRDLSLRPISKMNVSTVGGGEHADIYEAYVYLVNIYLPNRVALSGFPVVEMSAGVDVLIGMDVVRQGDMAITNFEGKTIFTFRVPSAGKIDFVEDVDEYNRHKAMRDQAALLGNRKTRRAAEKNKRKKR